MMTHPIYTFSNKENIYYKLIEHVDCHRGHTTEHTKATHPVVACNFEGCAHYSL